MKLVWIDAPKALVAVTYVMLGWVAVAAFPDHDRAAGRDRPRRWWPWAGCSTRSGRWCTPSSARTRRRRVFGYHEVFHALVILAAALQYAVIAFYVIPAPERPGPSLGSSQMDELDALGAFLVAALIAFAATPPVARLARRLGVLHHPRDRDLHDRPVPGLGGLAILAAVVVAALIFLPWNAETRGIIGGALAIALRRSASTTGARTAFTRRSSSPASSPRRRSRLRRGVWVENVTLPFVDPLDLNDWGKALTLVGMVAVMNVVNFTDGADGLAAGVCTIAAATFAVIALSLDRDVRRRSWPRSRPAPRWGSSGTTSTRRRSSWATPARTCSGCCSPAWRSRAC